MPTVWLLQQRRADISLYSQAIKNGKKAKISEWLAGLPTPGHVNTVADARELKYATGDSEVSSKGMTALHYAAFYSKVDIVGMLLKAGAGKGLTHL